MVEAGTIIESIYYLLKRIGPTDKLKLVKLLYFADKFHLIKYGRTITNDEYWAMDHGPVGSNIKDVLEYDSILSISKNELKYAEKFFSKVKRNKFQANDIEVSPEFNFLSETDIEALDMTIKHFSSMSTWKIRDFSHKYPEWTQYEELFENKETRRERIQTEELISIIPNDPFGFSAKDIENAKSIFNGVC
ncbi:MAG: SocA family protein [Candidatus Omnitrophica bacterium]|nr:SocA family protein [Candidatus Omnitrophota bacterium]MBU4477675.1 SocA family protein [Candidatus Omnitrophota bacterium]MCG2703872.1 SocA family protein [Candidatus Omnitrophota bacterium]